MYWVAADTYHVLLAHDVETVSTEYLFSKFNFKPVFINTYLINKKSAQCENKTSIILHNANLHGIYFLYLDITVQ